MCKEWDNYEQFVKDMGEKPTGMSLDRIDNNGPYSKDNCRWATRAEQNNNTRRSRLITHDGLTMSQQDWEKKLGFKPTIITRRLKRGWSVEEALIKPSSRSTKRKRK